MSGKWIIFVAALGLLAAMGLASAQTAQGSSAGTSSTGSKATTPGGSPQAATSAPPQSSAPTAAPGTQPPADAAMVEPKGRVPKQKISAPSKQKLININAATKAELKSLPGGSDEEADKIIAGRPYKSKSFLVENKIIPMGRYIEIRKMIVAGDSPKKSTPAKQ